MGGRRRAHGPPAAAGELDPALVDRNPSIGALCTHAHMLPTVLAIQQRNAQAGPVPWHDHICQTPGPGTF